MHEIDMLVHIQRQKDLQREAANERQVRALNGATAHNRLRRVRESLGRGLVTAGEQLLRD